MTRPVVLLDIDGVFCNFIEGGIFTAQRLWAGRFDSITHDDINSLQMEKALGLTENETAWWLDAMKIPGYCRSLKPYPGAEETVSRLREIADVHPVTAPFGGFPHWMYERTQWLCEVLGFSDRDIIHTKAKHLIKGDILVEDTPAALDRWMERHPDGTPVLMRRPYNESCSCSFVVENLVGLTTLVEHLYVSDPCA